MNRRVIDKIRLLAVALCALSVTSFGQQAETPSEQEPPGGFEFEPGKPVIEFPHDQKKDDLRYDPGTGKWTTGDGVPFGPDNIYDEAAKAAWAAMASVAELQSQINALGMDVEAFLQSGGELEKMLLALWDDVFNAADSRYEPKKSDDDDGEISWDKITGKPDPFTVSWANVTDRESGQGSIDALEKLTFGDGSITASGNTITIVDGLFVNSTASSTSIPFSYNALADKPLTKEDWESHKSENTRDVQTLTAMITALNDGELPADVTNMLADVAFSGSYNDLADTPTFGGEAEAATVSRDGDSLTFVMKSLTITNGMLTASDGSGDGITLKKLASTAAWADIENKPELYTKDETDAAISSAITDHLNSATHGCDSGCGHGGDSSDDSESHGEGGGGESCSCSIKSAEDVNDAEIDPVFTLWEVGFYSWQDDVNNELTKLKNLQRSLYDLVQTMASQALKPGILPGLL